MAKTPQPLRVHELGAITMQAAALIGTVGLLGAGYYGFHHSNTGVAIQKLVPEWQVQTAQTQPTQPLQCSAPPLATAASHTVVPLRIEYTVPSSDLACEVWFGSGQIKVRAELGGSFTETVSPACERKGGGQIVASMGVQLCPLVANVRARGHGSHWERLCTSCSSPPRQTCEGSKCVVQTYEGEGGVTGGYQWTRETPALLGIEGALKFRLEAGGAVTYRNSSQASGTRCGGCPNPDCQTQTLGLNLGESVATVTGDATLGPFRAQAEGQCRFTPNVSMTAKSPTCAAPTGLCSSGAISLTCGIAFRALNVLPSTATGATAWTFRCAGTWGVNECGAQGGVPNVPWNCQQEDISDIF